MDFTSLPVFKQGRDIILKFTSSDYRLSFLQAFLEGNRLFRESRFDVAKSQYSRALTTLQEQLTDVEVIYDIQIHLFLIFVPLMQMSRYPLDPIHNNDKTRNNRMMMRILNWFLPVAPKMTMLIQNKINCTLFFNPHFHPLTFKYNSITKQPHSLILASQNSLKVSTSLISQKEFMCQQQSPVSCSRHCYYSPLKNYFICILPSSLTKAVTWKQKHY